MIFIHGWSFSSKIWEGLEGTKLDLPFHGENVKFSHTQSILGSFVDQIGKDIDTPSTVVGWSLGATVVVLLALKHPQKVKKLVLVGFSPKFRDADLGHEPKRVKAFMLSLRKNFPQTVYNFRKTAVGSTFNNIPIPEEKGGYQILKEYADLDLTNQLKNIEAETVIIHGEKDSIVNPKAAYFTHSQVKNSKLFMFNTHHAPFLQSREEFVNLLKKEG